MSHLFKDSDSYSKLLKAYIRFSERAILSIDNKSSVLGLFFGILLLVIDTIIFLFSILLPVTLLWFVSLPLRAAGLFKKSSSKLTGVILPGWPRFWDLFRYLLPQKTQENVYEPAHAELLEDYLTSKRYRSKWAKRWINFCFAFRTILLIFDCWRVLLTEKSTGLLLLFLPSEIRDWLSRFNS